MAERQANLTPTVGVSSYTPLSANATTLIKTGGGILQRVTINKAGATGNTITLYDALSAVGTPIATIDAVATLGGRTLEYGLAFATGLTVVIATGTAADITVVWA